LIILFKIIQISLILGELSEKRNKKFLYKNPRATVKEIKISLSLNCSTKTIRRLLKRIGIKSR